MIGLIDCIGAIAAALEGLINVTPIMRDSLEDINDPGLYIVPASIESEIVGDSRHDIFELVVAWYGNRAIDRYADLLEMQERFRDLFMGRIPVPGAATFLLYPEALSFDLDAQEGTLFATFTIQNFQLQPDAETEGLPTVETMEMGGDVRIDY